MLYIIIIVFQIYFYIKNMFIKLKNKLLIKKGPYLFTEYEEP